MDKTNLQEAFFFRNEINNFKLDILYSNFEDTISEYKKKLDEPYINYPDLWKKIVSLDMEIKDADITPYYKNQLRIKLQDVFNIIKEKWNKDYSEKCNYIDSLIYDVRKKFFLTTNINSQELTLELLKIQSEINVCKIIGKKYTEFNEKLRELFDKLKKFELKHKNNRTRRKNKYISL